MSLENLPPWIKSKILRGEAVLFLGAGASYGAKGPNGERPLNGGELRDRIADEFLGGAMKDSPLAKVAEYAKMEGGFTELQRFIHTLFEPLQPADFHLRIPEFRWHAILTTNFDFVIERAYQKARKPLQTLGRIIRDDDKSFPAIIASLEMVPFLKLHGCLSTINDPSLPLVLATEEYAKYRKSRPRLFQHFQDWSKEHPVIFCGYDLADPNVQQILYDIGDAAINRSTFVTVRPNMTQLDERYWSSRRIVPISATMEDFLNAIDALLPQAKRALSALVSVDASSIQRWLVRGNPSEQLRIYLQREIDHVRSDMPGEGVDSEDFYRGLDDNWDAYRQSLDVPRRITDELLIEAVLDAPTSATTQTFLVKGYAGSGKSITLRRAAWDAATEHERLVLWVREGGLIRKELIREICALTDDRVFLFVEDGMRHLEEINRLLPGRGEDQLRLTIIMGARTNEWNVAGDQFSGTIASDYELRDLSDPEIDDLLTKLESAHCMGSLIDKDEAARKRHFSLSAERQLLVALHEATSGKPFEEIVLDEYRNIVPVEAQILYLDVCTLHRFSVGVRAGLLSRISGVTFSHFEDHLLKPLEHVVSAYFDGASRDYAYRTRHALVADWVFRQVLDDQEERSHQLVRIIEAMNTDYQSDKKAFEELIRGRDLAELFSDRVLADRVFEAAGRSGASSSHIEHQRAVFELNHPGGNTERALRALDVAERDAGYARQAILHTRAMVLRKKATEATNELAKQKYRGDAIEIFRRQVRTGTKPHAFHGLGQVLLDDLIEHMEQVDREDDVSILKERLLASRVGDIEKVIETGLQRFPGDSYVLSLEARLADLLQDSPRAMAALSRANDRTPENQHVAVRLAKMLRAAGDTVGARDVLQRCIDGNPSGKLVRAELAKVLIHENEAKYQDDIRRLLRSSFTDGDTNYESQFWYARHEFLFGDQAVSKALFETLAARSVPPVLKNSRRGFLKDEAGNVRRFDGRVSNKRDSFCFVSIPELRGDAFVHHSECSFGDWRDLHVGSRVELSVAFSFKGVQGVDLVLAGEA